MPSSAPTGNAIKDFVVRRPAFRRRCGQEDRLKAGLRTTYAINSFAKSLTALSSPETAKQVVIDTALLFRPFRAEVVSSVCPRAALHDGRRFALPWAGMLRPFQGESSTQVKTCLIVKSAKLSLFKHTH